MAAADVTVVAASETAMHPFFAQARHPASSEHQNPVETSKPQTHSVQDDPTVSDPGDRPGPMAPDATNGDGHGREEGSQMPVAKHQATLTGFFGGGQASAKEQHPLSFGLDGTHDTGDHDIDHDPNVERRKRRRMTPPESSPAINQDPEFAATGTDPEAPADVDRSLPLAEKSTFATPESSLQSPMEVETGNQPSAPTPESKPAPAMGSGPEQTTPKKKMLRLSASGTLGSPPKKQETKEEPSEKPKKRRGRPPKPKKELIVSMKYDRSGPVGGKVDQILSGVLKIPVEPTPEQPKQNAPKRKSNTKSSTKSSGSSKSVHPFFAPGQASKVESTGDDSTLKSPRKQSTTTPGKLRNQAQAARTSATLPGFGNMLARSGFEKNFKQPGVRDAPWPEADAVHQRALIEGSAGQDRRQLDSKDHRFPGLRKMKHLAVQISPEEDIMALQTRAIDASMETCIPESILRLPQRLLISDFDIQRTVQNVVRCRLPSIDRGDNSDTDDAVSVGRRGPSHPAVKHLYTALDSYLSPYDRHTCESEAWTHKYSPKLAAHVLSTTSAPAHLRDWLTSLTVNSVTSGPTKKSELSGKKMKASKAKKRKKPDDLADFIVDGGIQEIDTDEFVELDETDSDSPRPSDIKSEVRAWDVDIMSGRWSGKLANVTLISGPHGCGKTATVYAVAEELGFEIFEINSGTRRSGKDILDRVGDMTENHLVSRERRGSIASASDAGSTKKEVDSGRQGTMNAFFKPTTSTGAKSKPMPEAKVPAKKPEESQPPSTKPRREQKQSLILLEEVDILFEEDKNFWMTVFQLAASSKRPIILTCNNENAVPVQALNLHAILRLEPPSISLATDYLLLLAAREGHLLSRDSVSSLYEVKSFDLRASITELDFWCQMAIGDRKGGLEWLYQRWPPETDLDKHGRTLRVVSDGTYLRGMGWLHRDISESSTGPSTDRNGELVSQMWNDWNVHPEHSIPVEAPGVGTCVEATNRKSSLASMSKYLESISAADVYCNSNLPYSDDRQIDASLPPLSTKLRQSFTLDPALVEADPITDFTSSGSHLSVDVRALASSSFSITDRISDNLSEGKLISTIQAHANAVSPQLSRKDLYYTFEPIMEAPSTLAASTNHWTFSSFDRPLHIITTDLAPYVRNIVAHEQTLDDARIQVSGLLSLGGSSKRQRTTRASRVASEGGERSTKRPDHWFTKDLNRKAVMKTGGGWAGSAHAAPTQAPSQPSSSHGSDVEMDVQ